MKLLPIGIQTFSEIIHNNYVYVDKTHHIKKLKDNGKYYFLSRPRRFGKSLFLDTLQEAFEGNEKLFKGLYLEKNWDWTKKYPVIKISFGGGLMQTRDEIEEKFQEIIHFNKLRLNIECKLKNSNGCFAELIQYSYQKYKEKVVILIDEYDKPILDNITESKRAIQARELLKGFYSVIKENDKYIQFGFITGVSKFSKVSLFSGLNNLTDITIEKEFGTICGYTQSELESNFVDRLEGKDLKKIKQWYNGYSWLDESVYNPFGILSFFRKGEYENYWFETGTPTFLIEVLRKNRMVIPKLDKLQAGEELITSFDVDKISAEALLFQTGYLTIRAVKQQGTKKTFTLSYPNLEVKSSLNTYILGDYTTNDSNKTEREIGIYESIETGDLERLKKEYKALYSSIPYQWYTKNEIDKYEGYYASVFYSCMSAMGLDTRPEDVTNKGSIDLTVVFEDKVYVFEFKVVEGRGASGGQVALDQIKSKKYHEKYRTDGNTIYLVGIVFSREEKNIVEFVWEKL